MNTMLVTARPHADAPPVVELLVDPPREDAPVVVAPADDPVLDAISYTVRWHHFLAIPCDC